MTGLYLTDRALHDIDNIERYSVDQWGRRVADQYLDDLNSALGRLAQDLSLFGKKQNYAGRLRFYRARKHVIIGDILGGVGFVMTVWHGSMDFIERLPKLEPQLIREAEILAKLVESKGN